MAYYTKSVGTPGSIDYRVYFFNKEGVPISPFHDIPLWVHQDKGIVNMVVEIPQGTRPKLEISRPDPLNPIKQDVKKGVLRSIHDPYPFNYGAFPQTWENPNYFDQRTQAKGDNDPLDVCEISGKPRKTGDVIPVKILGTYAMVDEGETDWKILAIDASDPLAEKIDDHTHIPKDVLDKVFTFLRDYKIPDGNPPNHFAFDGELKDKKFAIKITEETHEQWSALVNGNIDKGAISIAVTTGVHAVPPQAAEGAIIDQFKVYLRNKN